MYVSAVVKGNCFLVRPISHGLYFSTVRHKRMSRRVEGGVAAGIIRASSKDGSGRNVGEYDEEGCLRGERSGW